MKKRQFHPFSLKDRLKSFSYAFVGIRLMIHSQHNAWIHLSATIAVVLLGIILKISSTDWALLLVAMIAVWVAEALNTAFEFLCDVAQPDFHSLVQKAKDVAAGAVLIAAIGAFLMGCAVFAPYLMPLFLS